MGTLQPHIRQRLTPERKALFLKTLRETGSKSHAARVATPLSRGNPIKTFNDEMERDDTFREEAEAALAAAHDEIRAEIKRRAIIGWESNVYQRGVQVFNADGTPAKVRNFSDRMLEIMARVLPELTDKKIIDANVSVNVENSEPAFKITKRDIFFLSPEQRRSLASCILAISRSRGDIADVSPIEAMPPAIVDMTSQDRDPWEDADDE